MFEERTTIEARGEELPGWWVRPEPAGAAPALLILPSIFGTDAGTMDLARVVAAWGGAVAIPDLFWRGDPGPCGFDEAGRTRAFARMRSYDRTAGLRDLVAWTRWLRSAPGGSGRVAALGICFGGHLAALLSSEGQVDAVVTVHGGGLGRLLGLADRMTAPMSLHFGDRDPAIPLDEVEAIRAAFADRADVEIVVHPGAAHGFAHPSSPNFQLAASEAGRASLKRLLTSLR